MLKSKINFDGGGNDNDNNKITLRFTGIHIQTSTSQIIKYIII